ncbi:MAG: hypothetical protein PHE55_22310, partial [Methylococcaceae bacterium]|nr:hypothetical protein [Methylococcaceae bacterium]
DTLAMAIGDNFNPLTLGAYDWALMARECRLNPRLVSRELKQMADKILDAWPKLSDELDQHGAHRPTLEGIGALLAQQCATARETAPEVLRVPSHLL